MTATTAPPIPAPAAGSTTRPAGPRRAGTTGAIDFGFALTLSALAIVGFRTTFTGHEELTVGLPAVLAGGAVGYLVVRMRAALLPAVAVAIVAFFLLGGVCALRDEAVGHVLPSPAVFDGLLDGSVNGWARVLTTVPPAGQAGNLLAVPYLSGFAAAALTVVLAFRYPRRSFCLVPPTTLLVVTVLFGTDRPASLWIQGAGFGSVAIAWVAVRGGRRRTVVRGTSAPTRRLASGALMLVLAGAGGLLLASSLPGSDSHERYVLRDQVEPPFDPRQYPSPLAGYRLFAGDDADRHDKTVLSVSGLPQGTRIRIGVLEDYDGTVWRAVGDGSALSGSFERVSSILPSALDGAPATVTVEIGDYDGVWLPTMGSPTALAFDGGRSATLGDSLRFDRATEAAAVSAGVVAGDRYTLSFTTPAATGAAELADRPLDSRYSSAPPALPPAMQTLVADIYTEGVKGATAPYAAAANLAELFRQYDYSDGGKAQTNPVVPPGHYQGRLARFLQSQRFVGNGEQYAAAMALVLRARGIPARVVMGFVPTTEGSVQLKGNDVSAWVELPLAGAGWVPFDPTPPKDHLPQPEAQQKRSKPKATSQPPPPTTLPPPADPGDELEAEEADPLKRPDAGDGGGGLLRLLVTAVGVASVPLLLLAIPAAAVAALKLRRRVRRRRRGTPAQRASSGWREITDLARDLGTPMPHHATRAEAGCYLGVPAVVELADRTDLLVFGAQEPTEGDASGLWSSVDSARQTMLAHLRRRDRWRAAVSLNSLRELR